MYHKCYLLLLFLLLFIFMNEYNLTMYFCQWTISTLILNNRAISEVIIAAHLYQRGVKSRDFKSQWLMSINLQPKKKTRKGLPKEFTFLFNWVLFSTPFPLWIKKKSSWSSIQLLIREQKHNIPLSSQWRCTSMEVPGEAGEGTTRHN